MSEIRWQKSSFSTDTAACVELALWQESTFSSDMQGDCLELAEPPGRMLLRESDAPHTVIATSPAALRALLATATGRWR
ncbi:DUF397 domain-containing protein [Streptomyces triculaminicus]|uniref:DUF397 domain-containing protein n=1 Tax=Streptomyces triculaminicus TaxID=2816232 RepID=A0A939FR42_9ACTN|nr:DUF397 domain-containing protein [Streptomyces triculaminicus]MBO0655143.1 DUF397 domain-containing protein [Streptomyces triculaminicus]